MSQKLKIIHPLLHQSTISGHLKRDSADFKAVHPTTNIHLDQHLSEKTKTV